MILSLFLFLVSVATDGAGLGASVFLLAEAAIVVAAISVAAVAVAAVAVAAVAVASFFGLYRLFCFFQAIDLFFFGGIGIVVCQC